MVYAPWASANENIQSLTLEDGTPLEDDRSYTVAAWAGSIDERYITSIAGVFDEFGTNQDLMTSAIREQEEIRPARDGRVILEWKKENSVRRNKDEG